MSSLKLKHSGGNSVSLNPPSSAPTSSEVAFKLPNADGSAGQYLKTDGSGNLSFAAASGTTINNNADNRIITGSGTANTLEAESGLTFNGSTLNFTAASGDARLTLIGTEGNDARITLTADDGDDHIDQWNLRSAASDNRFYIDQFESGSFVERFTIKGAHVGIANANPARELEILDWSGSGASQGLQFGGVGIRSSVAYASTSNHLRFYNTNNQVGSITTATSSTNYNTSSDYRLKENVVSISDGITRVKQLKPSRFNWISDKTNTPVDGFLAHEVSSIVPEAITGTKDAVAVQKDVDDAIAEKVGDPIYQSIDQNKLVPLLTAALQEAIAKIETLETKVAALEAG